MLDPASWQQYTEEVEPGKKIYRDHDCGSGRTLIVSNNEQGFSSWCFRCNDGGFLRHPEPSLPERLARLASLTAADGAGRAVRGEVTLPHDCVTDVSLWPSYAAVWLYKAGIGKLEIAELGAAYSPSMDRVVIPVFTEGRLVYWQARAFTAGRPKWINPDVDKATVLPRYGWGKVVVLTEDILSAYRVGKVAQAVALMGTSLTDAHLAYLLDTRRPVLVWLDGDAAGTKAASRVVRQLSLVGLKSDIIVTARDPKLLFTEEITNAITEKCGPWGLLPRDPAGPAVRPVVGCGG